MRNPQIAGLLIIVGVLMSCGRPPGEESEAAADVAESFPDVELLITAFDRATATGSCLGQRRDGGHCAECESAGPVGFACYTEDGCDLLYSCDMDDTHECIR